METHALHSSLSFFLRPELLSRIAGVCERNTVSTNGVMWTKLFKQRVAWEGHMTSTYEKIGKLSILILHETYTYEAQMSIMQRLKFSITQSEPLRIKPHAEVRLVTHGRLIPEIATNLRIRQETTSRGRIVGRSRRPTT